MEPHELRRAVELALARMQAAVERAGPDIIALQERLRLFVQLERAKERIAELEAKLKEKS
jgi:endonuclease/exonuclease/phosphatase family metal-dependent hydrolase